MKCSRSPRPEQLVQDSRADSPMRDDVGILHRTPLREYRSNGSPTTTKDASSAAFTAVNSGDGLRATSFRPDEPAPRPITLPPAERRGDGTDERAATGPYHAHNWRPTELSLQSQHEPVQTIEHDEELSGKRKRASSSAGEPRNHDNRDHLRNDQPSPPKRRVMDTTEEKSADPQRPREGRENAEAADTVPIERLPTPEARKGHSKPPPAPRPEVEAALRAQVQHFASHPSSRPGSGSSPEDDQARQRSRPGTSDHAPGAEDKSKRKRNFSNRTKTGCHTCRMRKKKCDEGRPDCQNCLRGSFHCAGYGPKPPGGLKPVAGRAAMPIQAKQNESYTPDIGPQHGFERGHYQDAQPQPAPTSSERYSLPQPRMPDMNAPRHVGPPFPIDARLPPGSDGRQARPHVQYDDRREPPPPPLPPPSVQYIHPDLALPPPPPLAFSSNLPPPPPPSRAFLSQMHGEPLYPLPPHAYRPITMGNHTVINSRDSVISSGSGSHYSRLPAYLQHSSAPATARSKMLRGERYKHFQDLALRNERNSCRKAVEAYNDSCKAVNPSSSHEQERNFLAIYEPRHRSWESNKTWDGPNGSVGSHSIVETPFNCEFGYNIHLGKDVLIQQNCTLQDASIIYIGDRTVIGPNVKLYCITTSVDAQQRRGGRGEFQAGPIIVEEDVVIHADCIILPFRTIGKGAVVGAGSVVTRDVKPYTVVAGNPARPLRKSNLESGPNADRHSDEIQKQNDEMLHKLLNNEVIPRDD